MVKPPVIIEPTSELSQKRIKTNANVKEIQRTVNTLRTDDFSPRLNSDEVDNCFYCPLEGFLSKGEGYSYRDWEFVEGRHIRVHFFQRGRHQVWGLTAVILIKVGQSGVAFHSSYAFDLTSIDLPIFTACLVKGGA